MVSMIRRSIGAAVAAGCLLATSPALAAVYTYTGPTSTPGSLWSDPANWNGGGGGAPSTRDDVGMVDGISEQVTYDTAASGVLGGMQITGRKTNQRITVARDLLLDYTGNTGDATTPAGWLYVRSSDGFNSYLRIAAGSTLRLTGFKVLGDAYTGRYVMGTNWQSGGTIKFAPDAAGKGYLYLGGTVTKDIGAVNVDFGDLTTIECMNDAGTGRIQSGLLFQNKDQLSSGGAKAVTIGRTDGADQRFAAQASVTDASNGRLSFASQGMDGRYGPKLVVNASGTASNPNRIYMDAEAIGGLEFGDNGYRAGGGSWMQAAGTGVARLVLEGDLLTADNAEVASLWASSQIEIQMAGELSGTGQTLRWCAHDLNGGGAGDLMDFSGFTNNYAVRKLIVGSDEGTAANAVTFASTPAGKAMYLWGLEFMAGGYLEIGASDYIYYLGAVETVGGIAGMGLTLPAGTTLADFTNRPENIVMLGVPEPATLALLSITVVGLLRRRRR